MYTTEDDTADRKRYLVLKSHVLRAHLLHESEGLARSAHTAEHALGVLGRLRQHPEWLIAGALAVLVLKPGRIAAWLRGTAFGMRTWRQFLPLLMALRRT